VGLVRLKRGMPPIRLNSSTLTFPGARMRLFCVARPRLSFPFPFPLLLFPLLFSLDASIASEITLSLAFDNPHIKELHDIEYCVTRLRSQVYNNPVRPSDLRCTSKAIFIRQTATSAILPQGPYPPYRRLFVFSDLASLIRSTTLPEELENLSTAVKRAVA
jgi:hypothetical protein